MESLSHPKDLYFRDRVHKVPLLSNWVLLCHVEQVFRAAEASDGLVWKATKSKGAFCCIPILQIHIVQKDLVNVREVYL